MSNDPTASQPPPKRPKCPIKAKEKAIKVPPIPLPVTKVSGVDSEWYNDDSVTNLLPPAALEKRSKEKNPKAEGKKESMKEEMKALAACVSV